MYKGVIFDFNGTLFWDTKLQNDSWDKYLERYNVSLSEMEKRVHIHGRNGKDTFEFIFKRELSSDEIEELTEEKEILYREECLKSEMKLAPGADSLIGYLISKNVKIAIATASGKKNVDFFINKFDLLKYFPAENIVYNDGTVRGKPHPDLFEKALEAIRTDRKEVIIFEDSVSGVEAAEKCGAGKIVIVNSNNENYDSYNYLKISHFDDFNRNLIL